MIIYGILTCYCVTLHSFMSDRYIRHLRPSWLTLYINDMSRAFQFKNIVILRKELAGNHPPLLETRVK